MRSPKDDATVPAKKITDDPSLYRRVAKIIRWRDGDTVEVEIDQGFDDAKYMALRLRGINCQELDEADGERALNFSHLLCPPDSQRIIQVYRKTSGRYETTWDRYAADITMPDGTQLADQLIAAGLGVIDSRRY